MCMSICICVCACMPGCARAVPVQTSVYALVCACFGTSQLASIVCAVLCPCLHIWMYASTAILLQKLAMLLDYFAQRLVVCNTHSDTSTHKSE